MPFLLPVATERVLTLHGEVIQMATSWKSASLVTPEKKIELKDLLSEARVFKRVLGSMRGGSIGQSMFLQQAHHWTALRRQIFDVLWKISPL